MNNEQKEAVKNLQDAWYNLVTAYEKLERTGIEDEYIEQEIRWYDYIPSKNKLGQRIVEEL